jgi:hypothetical protein
MTPRQELETPSQRSEAPAQRLGTPASGAKGSNANMKPESDVAKRLSSAASTGTKRLSTPSNDKISNANATDMTVASEGDATASNVSWQTANDASGATGDATASNGEVTDNGNATATVPETPDAVCAAILDEIVEKILK